MLTVMQAMCEIAADRASKLQKAWSITIFSGMAYHRQLHSCPPKDLWPVAVAHCHDDVEWCGPSILHSCSRSTSSHSDDSY